MTTYKLPKEPAGPVWDLVGDKWERRGDDEWLLVEAPDYASSTSWSDLLDWYGPLTDMPPIKAGDTITWAQFLTMPEETVVRSAQDEQDPRGVFVNIGDESAIAAGEKPLEFHQIPSRVRVLEIGTGETND